MRGKVKNMIDPDGIVDQQKYKRFIKKGYGNSDFHWGGYLLGLLLGPLGVIITYFFNDDYRLERIKWAWWGFAGFVAAILIGFSILLYAA